MPIISIIAAIDENNGLGKNNQLLCHLPNDLKYFKSVTQGHTVIMGRNTYESLPNGALPNRRNIILTRNKDFKAEKCEIASSLTEAINMCSNEEEVFIIGGGSAYRESILLADKLYITYIHHSFEGVDVFFPAIDKSIWHEISRQVNEADDKNIYPHSFVVYTR